MDSPEGSLASYFVGEPLIVQLSEYLQNKGTAEAPRAFLMPQTGSTFSRTVWLYDCATRKE